MTAHRTIALVTFSILLWITPRSLANTAATITSPGNSGLLRPGEFYPYGWQFALSEYIRVTEVGFYDRGHDGLLDPHLISFWRPDRTFLGSAQMGAQTGALEGDFRYISIQTLDLSPGICIISAQVNTVISQEDLFPNTVGSISMDPAITYSNGRYDMGSYAQGLKFPTIVFGGPSEPPVLRPQFQVRCHY